MSMGKAGEIAAARGLSRPAQGLQRMRRIVSKLSPHHLVAAFSLFATSAPAYAYVDPGTGSMLIQLAFASVAGALFFLRDLRQRIVGWFSKSNRPADDSAPVEPNE